MNIDTLLCNAVSLQASDLHLSAGHKPLIRVDGELQTLSTQSLTKDELLKAFHGVMSPDQRHQYAEQLEYDFSYEIHDVARFRVNVFNQSNGPGAVFRIIPHKTKSLDQLDTPSIIKQISQFTHGLVLITGPTGSGKSTTMAGMVDYINIHYAKHIITIENPIEYLHQSKKSLINQREVGRDTGSFDMALRSALREDPDVILVGEMRDVASVRLALTAAETGHLVISTLHTNSAPETINRIINVFPAGEQGLVREILSTTLQAVISQRLLKRLIKGRIAAYEIMICNSAIRHQIRDNKIAQIVSSMQTGQSEGMCTMDQYVKMLMEKDVVLV